MVTNDDEPIILWSRGECFLEPSKLGTTVLSENVLIELAFTFKGVFATTETAGGVFSTTRVPTLTVT